MEASPAGPAIPDPICSRAHKAMNRPQRAIHLRKGAALDEIVTEVFTWAWFSEPHGYDFNGHLVRHADGNLCIDPVQPNDACLAEIARMGLGGVFAPLGIDHSYGVTHYVASEGSL